MDKKELLKELSLFLVRAKKQGYASGDESKEYRNKDQSKGYFIKEKNWIYHDFYYGGEPFGGQEIVYYKKGSSFTPFFIMLYYGKVLESVKDFKEIYNFLRKALSLVNEKSPYRGPKNFKEGNFEYKNKVRGKVDDFQGEEVILKNGKEVYRTKYIGGLVNIRKE